MSQREGGASGWHRLADVLHDTWQEALSAGGTVGFAAVGLFDDGAARMLLWGGSLLAFGTGTACIALRRPRRTELLRENRALHAQLVQSRTDYWEFVESYLATLVNDTLAFSDRCRVSLYLKGADRFECVGRYSKNPEYHRKGRALYPLDQGCIGMAWRDGFASLSAPDPEASPEAYFKYMHDEGDIPRGVMADVTMKSRELVAYALEDGEGYHRIGVVVFESTRPEDLDRQRLDTLIHEGEGRKLAGLLGRGRAPQVGLAQQEGF